MAMFKRISLFLITNILVIATISIASSLIMNFLGINPTQYYPYIIVMSLVWGMGGAFISLLMSKFMAKMAMGVKIIPANTQNPEQREILEMVHSIARKAQLPKMPEVGVYESPEINAFATGPSRSNSLVAVSTGLLGRMNRDEVEGVIGHEVAHVANGDMVTMTLIQGVVNSFVIFFARIIANVVASQVEEKSRHIVYMVSSIVLDIVFSILGSIVVAYFSRAREFRADAGGAKYAGREKMLAGLRKLQANFSALQPDDSSVATLKISSKPAGIMALFSSHPPLPERIRRLERA